MNLVLSIPPMLSVAVLQITSRIHRARKVVLPALSCFIPDYRILINYCFIIRESSHLRSCTIGPVTLIWGKVVTFSLVLILVLVAAFDLRFVRCYDLILLLFVRMEDHN